MSEVTLDPAVVRELSSDELDRLSAFGARETKDAGETLFREGDREIALWVVLSGAVDIRHRGAEGAPTLTTLGPNEFAGDTANITGQAAVAEAMVAEAGEFLRIDYPNLQRVLVEDSSLSDALVSTLVARRAYQRASGRTSISLIGRRYDRHAFAIRDLLEKNAIPYVWLDADDDSEASAVLNCRGLSRETLPVLVDANGAAAQPKLCEVSERYGLSLLPGEERVDVVVVGAGPAGLSASVYAASEGLSVVTLDSGAPGGQAGTSSKIENYLGFPTGVSGRELAERAWVQAQKFGARIAATAAVVGLEKDAGGYRLQLADGRAVKSRSVVLASGARYRRLPVEGLEEFEDRGVYYGATQVEAQLCGNQPVAVVGAGNSAGQAAMFLSQTAEAVHMVFRRASMRDSMSEYLVRRLEETPNVHLHPFSEVEALRGCEARLRGVVVRNNQTQQRSQLDTPFLFLFLGADPNVDWLQSDFCRDEKGFVRTGETLAPAELVTAGWSLSRMPTHYETCWPRVYAVGDLRAGSVKRVASAVGEGAVVVSAVHDGLAEMARASEPA